MVTVERVGSVAHLLASHAKLCRPIINEVTVKATQTYPLLASVEPMHMHRAITLVGKTQLQGPSHIRHFLGMGDGY